jgi:hypothetical protein
VVITVVPDADFATAACPAVSGCPAAGGVVLPDDTNKASFTTSFTAKIPGRVAPVDPRMTPA